MPNISVIVPVYNVETYIDRCIQSILSQSFCDFDLILIDDGSQDKSGFICDAYQKTDSRITVLHQQNQGLSAARNAGLDLVFSERNSDWIAFIDSDDWIHPRYLELLYSAAQDLKCSVSICNFARVDDEAPSSPDDYFRYDERIIEDVYCENRFAVIASWGKLFKKSCFAEMRFPIGRIHEDEFIIAEILFPLQKCAYFKASFYYYYKNPNSITLSPWSPANIDLLDALNISLAFMEKNGYRKAAKQTAEYYSKIAARYFYQIVNKPVYKKEYLPVIRHHVFITFKKSIRYGFFFKNPKARFCLLFEVSRSRQAYLALRARLSRALKS